MQGSIRQRSPGSWELTVDLGRDQSGKRQRRYQTVRGTKAHATRELRKLLTNLDHGMNLPDDRILVREVETLDTRSHRPKSVSKKWSPYTQSGG